MRHLEKVASRRPGWGYVSPRGQGQYSEMKASVYFHRDDMLDASLDVDEWVSSVGGTSTITVTSGVATLHGSTATGGTITSRIFSAMSAGMANVFNVPFRVNFVARISATAGAGVAPTGGLDFYLGVRDTGDTHIARFHLDGTTAGSSSCASPVVNTEIRAGSSAAGYIASAAFNPFTTAADAVRTATAWTGYSIEVTHRGTYFGVSQYPDTNVPPQLLKLHAGPNPRLDKNYYLDMRMVADGTAGYTQTAGLDFEISRVEVEQLTPQEGDYDGFRYGPPRTLFGVQARPSASLLATTGAGVFLGFGVTSTATAGTNLFVAAFDASAASSALVDHGAGASASARMLWIDQVRIENSAAGNAALKASIFPTEGVPFYRGLVVGSVNASGGQGGSSACNVVAVWKGQP
jgi:hypothetical protein